MKRILFWMLVALIGLAAAIPQARADGFIVVDESYWRGLMPQPIPPHWPAHRRPYAFAPLEVSYHHVNVKVTDQIATTSVDQEFYNPNSQRLEGTYLFPIPKGAQIDKFTMDIGGKQVEAELLPADKARRIYEDIVRKLKDPALMEYADRDVFKVRIFPIEPHSKKRITLSYTQLLKSDSGLVNYTYPLNTEKFSAKPIKDISIKLDLETKQPLKSIYSPSHTVEIKRHGANRATVGYETTDAKPDTDFTLYFAPEKDELGINLITHKLYGEDGYFVLLASPGAMATDKKLVLKDVAFVLDTSGSMAGKKLEQAKKALQFCVENLNDGDRFEIIRFSTETEPLFDKLVEATKANRQKASEFIDDLKPIGGTTIDDALQKALALQNAMDVDKTSLSAPNGRGEVRGLGSDSQSTWRTSTKSKRPFVIIFLTDGKPTIGTTDENQIVKNVEKHNDDNTRIFCFGIGNDLNTHLLDKITEQTRAFSQYVLPEEDIEVKVSSFFSRIKEPVLANPTLKFTGDVRVAKLYPSALPDLFRGDQIVLVGRYSGEGDSAVILEGTVNGATRKFTYEVSFPKRSAEHEFIPRLWANRRVGYLLDEIRLHGENSELRDEVTDLARKYGIVTPYTAYLIVEDEDRRGVPVANQTLPQLYFDTRARREAGANWEAFKQARGGAEALSGARYGNELKYVDSLDVARTKAPAEANRALGITSVPATPAPSQDSKTRLVQFSDQGQFINGRNFYRNDAQWVDSTAQNAQSSKRQRIQFNSTEYFNFAANNSEALPWLALGQNVQFVLGDTLYEIYDTTN
jgi:Ca-activated chloride channel family protein